MVVPLALLLQVEPSGDIVQLGGVGQVDEDLGPSKAVEHTSHYIYQTLL